MKNIVAQPMNMFVLKLMFLYSEIDIYFYWSCYIYYIIIYIYILFIYVNTWDGVALIIRARGSCMKRMTIKILS